MASNNTADVDLIRRLKNRDPEALAAAYDRYSSSAYGVFVRITRDQSVAEDLLQELFLRVWNRAKDFDGTKGALGVWILAIARNMGIDYLRSADAKFGTRLRPIDNVDPGVFAHRSREPETSFDQERAVKTALGNLSVNEKRVLELAYFEGCSQTEIAARIDEPLGTVKTWMRNGMGRLRTAMKLGAAQ